MKKILQLTEALITQAEKIEPRTPDLSVLIGGLHTARDQAQKILAGEKTTDHGPQTTVGRDSVEPTN